MKKEIIDQYEIFSKDGAMKYLSFIDVNGKRQLLKVDKGLELELKNRKHEIEHERNQYRRYHGRYLVNYELIEDNEVLKVKSAELEALEKMSEEIVIDEIYKLPFPQNRRAYRYLIEGKSYSEIAIQEHKNRSVIKRSVDVAINKIRNNLKKFKNI